MVSLVVRDSAWRTLTPSKLVERARGERWTVDGRTVVGSGTLLWRMALSPRARGMEVQAMMCARGSVLTNRSGLVVLLPATIFAGARFVVRHADTSEERGVLPRDIAPHQPILDAAVLRLSAPCGPALAFTFAGDTFEMEDQRNWLDPSFKLYNRPLARPFPYRIRNGAEIEQRIEIDVVRMPARPSTALPRRRRSRWSNGVAPLPDLGLATAPGRVPGSPGVVNALRVAGPDFVLHRTDASATGLRAAARLARALGAELKVEAFGEGGKLADTLRDVRPRRVAAYFSGPRVDAVLSDDAMEKVGGTFADFVMLNRRGVSGTPSRIAFALCPTVHARDDRSLIETLEAMPAVLAQVRRLAGSRPVDAGPCTLLRRLVPANGRPAARGPKGTREPYDVDPRQCEHIAAAWLACVIALAGEAGIASVCTFEAAGSRGVICLPDDARRVRGACGIPGHSSSYQLLCALSEIRAEGITLLELDARVGAAFLVHGKWQEIWLVELSGRPRRLPRGIVANASDLHLKRGRHGARWAALRSADRVEGYATARLRSVAATRGEWERISRAWCR